MMVNELWKHIDHETWEEPEVAEVIEWLKERGAINYEAASERLRALMPQDWEREPWPLAFIQLTVDAALGGTE